ncbi:SDR family oxidoreductase [Candidatus Peribacteria bacterium]|nr:SDR family oxidoreductase [Candidatus Peribacteria bacterium]
MKDNADDLKGKIPPEVTHFVNMTGSVKFAESARQEVEAVNLRGAITLAKLALAQGKLTHISTAYIL